MELMSQTSEIWQVERRRRASPNASYGSAEKERQHGQIEQSWSLYLTWSILSLSGASGMFVGGGGLGSMATRVCRLCRRSSMI
jgi:hypothetical protein